MSAVQNPSLEVYLLKDRGFQVIRDSKDALTLNCNVLFILS